MLRAMNLPYPETMRRVLALDRLDELWGRAGHHGGSVWDRLVRAMGVGVECGEGDLGLLPRSGPAIVVANHPHGFLDGIVAAHLLSRVRTDVKILGNALLGCLPEVSEHILTVDVFQTGREKTENMKALRETLRWLDGGGVLLVFPGGTVSRFNWSTGRVADPPWSQHFAGLAKRSGARVVPMHISGGNSLLFHVMSQLHERLGTGMLAREMMKQCGRRMEIRIGEPVAASVLDGYESRGEATAFLRSRVESLGQLPTRLRAGANK